MRRSVRVHALVWGQKGEFFKQLVDSEVKDLAVKRSLFEQAREGDRGALRILWRVWRVRLPMVEERFGIKLEDLGKPFGVPPPRYEGWTMKEEGVSAPHDCTRQDI